MIVPACDGNNDAGNGDTSQGNKLENNESICGACSDLGGQTVEESDEDQTNDSHGLVDPYAGIHGGGTDDGSDEVFSKDNGDDCGGTGFEDYDSTPSEQEASPFTINLAQVYLRTSIQGHGSAEFGVAGCTRPGQQSSNEPNDQSSTWSTCIDIDLGRGREDA